MIEPPPAPSSSSAASRNPQQRQDQQQHQQPSTKATTQDEILDIHTDFLRALEPQLAEIKESSLALGSSLDTQNRQLERLDSKIDRVQDDMKQVSVKMKEIEGRKLLVHFRFRCALQEMTTRKFLQDVEGEPMLT